MQLRLRCIVVVWSLHVVAVVSCRVCGVVVCGNLSCTVVALWLLWGRVVALWLFMGGRGCG